jgi:acetolactate synthase-1/2/3 large subunit
VTTVPSSSVSTRIADTLSRHVTDVFGVMGNGNARFIEALFTDHDDRVRYTAVRHETAAVAAAVAYYRASGRIAVATATYGAGLTNTLTALTEAVQARIPLLLVVGDAPTSGRRPWDIDQEALASSIGATTFTVSADTAGHVTIAALEYALNHRTPVVLAIPYDLTAAEAADEAADDRMPPRVTLTPPVAPDSQATDAAAAVLARAERPLILAGRGAWVSGAGAALGRLADALGAVTTSTALGRGIFPRPQFDLGVTGGFGHDDAMALVRTADVVLVVGASLNQFTTKFGTLFAPGTTVVRIDDDIADNIADDPDDHDRDQDQDQDAQHPSRPMLVVGDARRAVEEIVSRLDAIGAPASGWREAVPGLASGAFRHREAGEEHLPDGLLDPRRVAARLAELLPEDRIVVSDGGHFIGWANTYWEVSAPNRMLMVGTAFQSIGLGFPSAVGATTALPDSLLVVTTGDGGGLMGLADLDSVIRSARRGVIIVWNDAAYGAEIHMYGRMGLDPRPMLIEQADFAALSRALGGRGDVIRTLSDLSAFERWLKAGVDGVYLLDCRISRSIIAPYQHEIYEHATTER